MDNSKYSDPAQARNPHLDGSVKQNVASTTASAPNSRIESRIPADFSRQPAVNLAGDATKLSRDKSLHSARAASAKTGNQVDLNPPLDSVNSALVCHYDLEFIRGWTCSQLRAIADSVEAQDPAYKAPAAVEDILDIASRLIAWNLTRTRQGAAVDRFSETQDTARRHLGEAAYRWIDGGHLDFRTRSAA
ncbi:HAMP domain-containing protein [Inquilinus ginsengisoli]|uniref:HAMP domain-containing protein n=1 Tax=Inquilinus ginsengisoli TaxID=363840 RepID=A0ABU1JJ38_9PROT|nr:hypothetical protein [Inquilinus ginsengisoli]MDR6288618.1 HAMP domain-containing protein [Inquilinus ginsengisoli]